MEKENQDVWEAVRMVSGDIFIYRGGYKEEADIKDVIEVSPRVNGSSISFQVSRFDFNPITPAPNSKIKINKKHISFSWYVDPKSSVIESIKRSMQEMDASKSGILLAKSSVNLRK